MTNDLTVIMCGRRSMSRCLTAGTSIEIIKEEVVVKAASLTDTCGDINACRSICFTISNNASNWLPKIAGTTL